MGFGDSGGRVRSDVTREGGEGGESKGSNFSAGATASRGVEGGPSLLSLGEVSNVGVKSRIG